MHRNIERALKPVAVGLAAASLGGLAAGAASAKRENNTPLVNVGTYKVDGQRIVVKRQKGFVPKSDNLKPPAILAAVKRVERFKELSPTVGFGFIFSSGNADFGANLALDSSLDPSVHEYDVLRDQATVLRVSTENHIAIPIPSPAMTLKLGTLNKSLLSPIEGRITNKYDPRLNQDFLGLQVETCNNLMSFAFDRESQDVISAIGNQITENRHDLLRLAYEAVCNSYGLAAASHSAKLPYSEYGKIVKKKYIPDGLSADLTIPFKYIPQRIYNQL